MNPLSKTQLNRTRIIRWLRFNLVAAVGLVVQLTTLALLNRSCPTHYLLTSDAALELTLLHNLAWHWRYTWHDRRERTTLPRALIRFHLSNGIVSLAGNLLLMRLLVSTAHLPVVPANLIAVLACGLANFFLGDSWVFAPRPAPVYAIPSRRQSHGNADSRPNRLRGGIPSLRR